MLKLEKTSRNDLITVTVRDKENFFTQPFALAFGIAIAIHLGLVILFQVVPFKIGMSENVFPPTRVHADMALKESTLAQITPAILSIRGLPPIPAAGPTPLSHPKFLAFRPLEFSKAKNSTTLSFAQIEKEIYQPEFNPLENKQTKPLEIMISGVLAEHRLVSNGMDEKMMSSFPSLKTDNIRIAYSVLVEGKTGKIFWYEPKQSAHDPIDKFAEAILHNMKFSIAQGIIVMDGQIEMHFNPNPETK